MSFGKAVVATRAPSTETYVQDGVTGLLVAPHDVEGMREAILYLWQNPEEAARMGRRRASGLKRITQSAIWLTELQAWRMMSTRLNMEVKKPRQVLYLILIVAVLFRVVAAFYMGDEVTELPGTQDQISYDALARSLLDGRVIPSPRTGIRLHLRTRRPPVVLCLSALPGRRIRRCRFHPLVARLLQGIVGGAVTCVLIYLLGRRLVNEETGLAGAALAAVYGYFIYYNVA